LAVGQRPRTGQVSVNGGAMNLSAPFGGYKQSGNGHELGRYGIESSPSSSPSTVKGIRT